MMRRQYVRQPSRAADWSLPPAVFAPVLAAVATIAHRTASLSDSNYILVLSVSFLLALAGACLALLGLRSLWMRAAIGGRRSAVSLFASLPVLIPAAFAFWQFSATAPLSDISTDTVDPPHFSQSVESDAASNANEPPRLNAELQKQFYPAATGRRYQLSADSIHAQVVALIEENGWRVRQLPPFAPGAGEWTIEAEVTTPVMGFRDEVIVRLTDEGESTFVDMRSASLFGSRDLGANARRIQAFMSSLDLRIQGVGGG
ncbi:MAG: DUF1499 domain-containing protein [Rhizobiaceae bacterium]